MSDKRLLIIRGVPGTGKSTIAEALVKAGLYDTIAEADAFFIDPLTGEYKYDKTKLAEAHQNCRQYALYCIEKGLNLIVSNTHTQPWQFVDYYEMGRNHGYAITEMILKSEDFKSIHGVSEDRVKEMRGRLYESLVDEHLDYVAGEF